jgi:hypothetical protein
MLAGCFKIVLWKIQDFRTIQCEGGALRPIRSPAEKKRFDSVARFGTSPLPQRDPNIILRVVGHLENDINSMEIQIVTKTACLKKTLK